MYAFRWGAAAGRATTPALDESSRARLQVHLVDAQTGQAAQASVEVVREGRERAHRELTVDSMATLEDLPPGRITVSIASEEHAFARTFLVVEAGTAGVVMLPVAVAVTVEVELPEWLDEEELVWGTAEPLAQQEKPFARQYSSYLRERGILHNGHWIATRWGTFAAACRPSGMYWCLDCDDAPLESVISCCLVRLNGCSRLCRV